MSPLPVRPTGLLAYVDEQASLLFFAVIFVVGGSYGWHFVAKGVAAAQHRPPCTLADVETTLASYELVPLQRRRTPPDSYSTESRLYIRAVPTVVYTDRLNPKYLVEHFDKRPIKIKASVCRTSDPVGFPIGLAPAQFLELDGQVIQPLVDQRASAKIMLPWIHAIGCSVVVAGVWFFLQSIINYRRRREA